MKVCYYKTLNYRIHKYSQGFDNKICLRSLYNIRLYLLNGLLLMWGLKMTFFFDFGFFIILSINPQIYLLNIILDEASLHLTYLKS